MLILMLEKKRNQPQQKEKHHQPEGLLADEKGLPKKEKLICRYGFINDDMPGWNMTTMSGHHGALGRAIFTRSVPLNLAPGCQVGAKHHDI